MPRAKNGYRHQEYYKGVKIDLSDKDEKILREKVRRRKNEIDAGLVPGTENMLVSTWADIWLNTYKYGRISEKNFKTYKCNLEKIKTHIGSMKLRDVKPIDLLNILNYYSGYSKSHIQHIKNAITGMFRAAKENGYISINPAAKLVIPNAKENTRRSLTPEERGLLLKACENHYAKPMVYLMLYAGLRPNECVALRWKHIDFENRLIHVTTAQESGTRNEKTPKTKAGIRDIPMVPILYNFLVSIKSDNPEDYVLRTSTGRPCTVDRLDMWWRSLLREMDMLAGAKVYRNKIVESKLAPDLKLYMLRHTFCTDLQRAGVPLNIARVLMGHSDIRVTAQIYTHYTDDQMQKTLEQLASFHMGTKGTIEGTEL